MTEKKNPSELQDVIRQETRRGRRPIDIEEKRRIDNLKRDLRTLLQLGTEDEFREAMLALGLLEDSEAFRETLRVWRDHREP